MLLSMARAELWKNFSIFRHLIKKQEMSGRSHERRKRSVSPDGRDFDDDRKRMRLDGEQSRCST